MAVTTIKSSKVTMYKMVSLPTMASGTKDSSVKTTQMSYRSFTTGLNRIGATINSTIVINKQIRDSLVQNLKLKDKEFEEEKKRFQKEKEEKNKIQKKTGSGFLTGVAEVAAKMTGGFLSGIAALGGALMKFVITQSVLRWIGNPANIQKLIQIVSAIISVVTFFSRFLRDNIVKMFEGLSTMLDGNKNVFQKLGGFVTFITGFGAILGGALILKKPGLVLKGVGWVLKTLWNNLSKTKGTLSKRSSGINSRSKGSRVSAGGGRFGGIAKGVAAASTIAVPMIVGSQMASGPDEFSSAPGSVSGGMDGGLPALAMGGIATKPTGALIGEAGPELRMPLDNAKRMKNAGIKPLSSLNGTFGKDSAKQTQKLSDLFMAPFRGIGAGILANISQVVSGMVPSGQALTPIIGNIITPVANSFGIPPSLVKTLTSKTQTQNKSKQQTVKKGDNSKLFGKGKIVKEDSKQFRRVGDTSVLGLLTNMLGAVQVIGNKLGGGSNQTITEQTSQSDPDNPDIGSKTTITASGKAGTGRMSQVAGTKEGIGVTDNDRNRQTNALEQNHIDFKDKGKDYTILLNPNNGEYKLFEKRFLGLANQEIMIGGPDGPKKGGENERLLRLVHNNVQSFFVKNAPEKGKLLKYIDQSMIDNFNKSKPKKSTGGWISGPMSGYPVSLDGITPSFIGHGTEWVGYKKAAGGSAFVVPFDTPATKNNPGLTGSRMRQAKQGGYALPGYATGGEVKDNKGSGDKGLKTATSGGAVITSKYGPRWGRFHAGIDLAGVPIGTPITSLTGGKVLYASTYSGYGNTVDLEVKPGKVLRFAHLDGFLVKKGDVIQPGSKIGTLGNTGIGTGPHLHYEHRSKLSFGQDGSFNPLESGALNDITIGGKPIQGAKPGGQTTEQQIKLDGQEEPESLDSLQQKLVEAVRGLNQTLGYAPQDTSVEKATKDAAKAKDDKAKQTKEATNKATAATLKAAVQNAKAKGVQNVPAASKPVILPGPSTIIPVEIAFAPTTSLYQPKIGTF